MGRMTPSLIVVALGAVGAVAATGMLAARCASMPRVFVIAWTVALFGLTIALAGQALGDLAGYSALTFRAIELGGQAIAPLAAGLALAELAAGSLPVRFGMRLLTAAIAIIAIVIMGSDPLDQNYNFSKRWPNPRIVYQLVPRGLIELVAVFVMITAAVGAVAVWVKSSRGRQQREVVQPALVTAAAAAFTALPGVSMAAHLPLPSKDLFALCGALAAGLVWFAARAAEHRGLTEMPLGRDGRPDARRGSAGRGPVPDDRAADRDLPRPAGRGRYEGADRDKDFVYPGLAALGAEAPAEPDGRRGGPGRYGGPGRGGESDSLADSRSFADSGSFAGPYTDGGPYTGGPYTDGGPHTGGVYADSGRHADAGRHTDGPYSGGGQYADGGPYTDGGPHGDGGPQAGAGPHRDSGPYQYPATYGDPGLHHEAGPYRDPGLYGGTRPQADPRYPGGAGPLDPAPWSEPVAYHGGSPAPDDHGARNTLFGQIAIYTLIEDRVDEFDELTAQVAELVRTNEPRTLVYIVHAVPSAPLQRILYEAYQDRAAYDEHMGRPYLIRYEADRRHCLLATNVIELDLKQAIVSRSPSFSAISDILSESGVDLTGVTRTRGQARERETVERASPRTPPGGAPAPDPGYPAGDWPPPPAGWQPSGPVRYHSGDGAVDQPAYQDWAGLRRDDQGYQ